MSLLLRLITVLFSLLHTFMSMLIWGWGRWLFCIVDIQGGDSGGGAVCKNVPVGCFDFCKITESHIRIYTSPGILLWVVACRCIHQAVPAFYISWRDTVMAEGVSRSVIAKQEQTISQENSLLILLELSLIPCCSCKNLGVVSYELLPQQNRTQVKIFSLSPGSDIMCATCIYEKL